MIHIYHGDGKGKTTAAMGLALRALGHGWRVAVVQFLKDGSSGEVVELAKLPGCTVLACPTGGKFTFQMAPPELAAVRERQGEAMRRAACLLEEGACDLLVLDEALDAVNTATLDAGWLLDLLRAHGKHAEIVVTGRNPRPEFLDAADYVTEMRAVKHPYERGVAAREGVEW